MKNYPFVLKKLKKKELIVTLRHLVAPDKNEEVQEIPDELFDAAKKYKEDNTLIRYLCKKYTMPPTDPRLRAYTAEEMLLEYVSDAIEDERISLGAGGRPIKKVMYKGSEIYQTGNKVFDAMEKEWAEQDLDALKEEVKELQAAHAAYDDEDRDEEMENFLDMIEKQVAEKAMG